MAARLEFIAASLQDEVTRGVKPALLAILGAVILVLVIACVNVTNLLLARGVHRRGEFALRAALGAGRSRLIRQLLTESLLLAAMGGVVGMAVAMLGVRALVALSPPGLPRVGAIGVDGAVFAFGLGITTLIGLAFGLIPALQAARSDPQPASPARLTPHRRRTPAHPQRAGRRGSRARARAARELGTAAAEPRAPVRGRRWASTRRDLLTMQVQTSGHRFDDDGATYRFFDQALEAVRRVPGVTAAALTSQLPLSGDLDEYGVHFEASPTQAAPELQRVPLRREPGLHRDDAHPAPARPAVRRARSGGRAARRADQRVAGQAQVSAESIRSASACASARRTDRPTPSSAWWAT